MKKVFYLVRILFYLVMTVELNYAQEPSWNWALSAGGALDDEANSVATDAAGNIYIAGYFSSSTIIFGSTVLTNANTNTADIFIAKYDPYGTVLWAKSAGGTGQDQALAITVDNSGNMYVAGYFSSPSISFGSFTFTNAGVYADIFIAKYDTDGNIIWVKSAGGSYTDYPSSIGLDITGNIIIAGCFLSNNITFGSTVLTNISADSTADIFLIKYSSGGNIIWAKSAGGNNFDRVNSLAICPQGNIYIAGSFISPVLYFNSISLTNVNTDFTNDAFLAKYDFNGNPVWAKSVGGTDDDYVNTIVVDKSEYIYMAGGFYSPTLPFGATILTNTGSKDAFIAKYDAIGSVLWARSAAGSNSDEAKSVITDVQGNIYLAGVYKSANITFNTYVLNNVSSNSNDIFVVKYDFNSNILWAKSVGGNKYDYARSLATDASGNIFLTGDFVSPSINFGNSTLTNNGDHDIFITKLNSSLGINEISNLSDISIFPNPTTDNINFNAPQKAEINIYNMNGKVLKKIFSTDDITNIDVSELTKGVYCIKVISDKDIAVKKFIKE